MPARPETRDEPNAAPPAAPDRPPRNVGFLLSQLGFAASRRFVKALEPLGIHPREFLLMRFVASSQGQSQQALAERLGVPPSRMVAIVDSLEERGLLERRPDPHDRRIRALHPTAKGRGVLERAIKIAIEHEAQVCSGLDEQEHEQLIELLLKLQPELIELPGVHPGLAKRDPASPDE
jgi:DNA-binding MarR family transcriptional regulator